MRKPDILSNDCIGGIVGESSGVPIREWFDHTVPQPQPNTRNIVTRGLFSLFASLMQIEEDETEENI